MILKRTIRLGIQVRSDDWVEVEAALSKCSLPTDCQRDEKIIRTIQLKAASHHIPTGWPRLHEEPVPAEILDVMTRRDGHFLGMPAMWTRWMAGAAAHKSG